MTVTHLGRMIRGMRVCTPRGVATAASLLGLFTAIGLRVFGFTVQAQQGPTARPAAALTPERALVSNYCLTCHDDAANEAGLSLETIVKDDVAKHADVWEK